jgi:hypothetical protein
MADFRRLLFVFAVVAFLTSLTVPAYADFGCTGRSDNRPARAESYNDLAGNIVLTCSGGVPTSHGSVIPPTTITVTANTNITSRILAVFKAGVKTQFNEALLIIDEPNTSPAAGGGNGRTLTNCGFAGEDSDPAAGPGVCQIIAPNDATLTYDGVEFEKTVGGSDFSECSGFGCGRPNVFQGRQANSLVGGEFNKIQFVGVPLDPPNSVSTRTIRIANVRINSNGFNVASPFSTVPVTATVSFAGALNIPDVTVQFATVELGMTNIVYEGTGFLQCVGTDQEPNTDGDEDLNPFWSGSAGMSPTGASSPTGTMDIRVIENFSTAWKVRNVQQITDNGVTGLGGAAYTCDTDSGAPCDSSGVGSAAVFDPSEVTEPAPVWKATDTVQNVPGVNYNTESGFENCWGAGSASCPNGVANNYPGTNPPSGYGSPVVKLANPFVDGNGTGIETAGAATQGTRIAIQVGNMPNGARLFFPIFVLLQNQSDAAVTGVMVADSSADATGFGGFKTATATSFSFTPSGSTTSSPVTNTHWREVKASSPVITYEILFTRADALEYADIVPAVVYNNNGLATDLPQAAVQATASVSFAPIQSGLSNPDRPQPDGDYSTPRFNSGFKTPGDSLYIIDKCACNLLFPWVVSAGTVDTGIVIANTSLDPCAGAPCTIPGFGTALPQTGVVTFYYFGTVGVGDHNPVANLAPNVSLPVPAGGYVAHVLSQNTSGTNGLGSRTNFAGYVIAQANFQWCHGVVDITVGPTPIFNYVGLQLDLPFGLLRTGLPGEVLGH